MNPSSDISLNNPNRPTSPTSPQHSVIPGLPGVVDEGSSPMDRTIVSPSLLPDGSDGVASSLIMIENPSSGSGGSSVPDGDNGNPAPMFGSPPANTKLFGPNSQLAAGIASFSTPNLVQLSEAEMAIATQPLSPTAQPPGPIPQEGSSQAVPVPASAIPPSFSRSQRNEGLSSSLGTDPAPIRRMHIPSMSTSSSDLVTGSGPGSGASTPGRWKTGTRSAFRKTTAFLGQPGSGLGSPRPVSLSSASSRAPRSSLAAEISPSSLSSSTPLAASAASSLSSSAPSTPGSAVSKLDPITQRCIDEGKIIMDDNQTEIKFATIDVLIERMTTESLTDSGFMQQFILTYTLHTSSDKLLDLMIARYHIPTPPNLTPQELEAHERMVKSVQLRIIVFLQSWFKRIWNSSTPPELTEKLEAFLDEIAKGPHKNAAERIKKLITRSISGEERKLEYTFNGTYPTPLLPFCIFQGFPPPVVSVRTIHPRELARQMTLVERDLFGALQSWEFQDLRFAKKDKSLAPNVNAITQQFNRVSRWFSEEILLVKDLDERIKTAELCIEVASQCQQLQNYNAVNEIISAFNTAAVHRLKRTWSGLSPRYSQKLAELSALMSAQGSFHSLRKLLHSIDPPFIPFLGVYLTDLTFIEEGNPTMRGDLINWKKCKLQARVLTEIETYKKTPYFLKEVPWITEFFKTVDPKETDDDMWNQSIAIEPRNGPAPAAGASGSNGADSASGDGSQGDSSSSSSKKEYVIVLPPGLPQFMGVQTNPTQTVADIKKAVLDLALKKGFLSDDEKQSDVSLNPEDYVLVAPATRQFPGVLIKELSVMSEMDFEAKGITGFAMLRTQQVIFVDYTLGPEAYFVLAFLDMDSALYSAVVLIDIIFKWQEEFCLMRYCSNTGDLFWLDPNFSLTQQQFDMADRIVVVPKSLLMRPDPEDRIRNRPSFLSKLPDCKYGYLTKCNTRQLLRTGIFLRPQPNQKVNPSLSVSSRSLQKTAEKGRRFFVVIDNFLFWYNDMQSATPKDVWNLSYCEVSYGTLVTGSLCVVIRMHPFYPFPKLRPKKLLILSANSDNVVRQWFTALASRSHFNEKTMIFSKSLRELVSRQKTSVIPDFVRYACNTIQMRSITVPMLFTYPVNMQLIEKMRNDINRGIFPRPSDMVEDYAIAQLLLSYFVEMPEPLLTNDLYSEFYTYHRSQSAVKLSSTADDSEDSILKLKAIIARLPVENAVTIYYIVKMLHVWEDASGEKKVALPLLQQILMRPPDNQSLSQISITNDVVETITFQIYTLIDKLGFPTDVQACENYVRPEVSYTPTPMPVTVFVPDVRREVVDSVKNERPLTDIDMPDSSRSTNQVRRAIIPRTTKGSGGSEASGTGRSASSDGNESSVSGNDATEESSSSTSSSSHHNIFSYFHLRKKKDKDKDKDKDYSQSARAALVTSSSSTNSSSVSTSPSASVTEIPVSPTSAPIPPPSSIPPPNIPPPSTAPPPVIPPPITVPPPSVPPPSTLPPAASAQPSGAPIQLSPLIVDPNITPPSFNPLPPMAMAPPPCLPPQATLNPPTSLPPMPMNNAFPFAVGSVPQMNVRSVEEGEVFENDLSDFVADASVSQGPPPPVDVPPPPFSFDASVPPMPMSPIVPQQPQK